eukprot:11210451-Ditylum_brightwellii.AAC.1
MLEKLFRTPGEAIPKLQIDNYTAEFLKELERTLKDPPKVNVILTTNDIKANYKNWKETTSTSPEERYFSIYKTWLKVPEEKAEDYKGLESDENFKVINTIINICKKHGIALP